ncbi:hypothetical protein [Segetibacter koreensis]|uniref:hypothetical protein n=1 Tax=Segetibacter koreensis TaxID=398037 RepID=UPI00035FA064|nr:hypothetical protein [Segetibacter koreensis]
MSQEIEISVREITILIKKWYYYFLSKWKVILLSLVLFTTMGVLYSWFQKPEYLAELTFTAENDGAGTMSAYAGIASQFGLDLGSSSGSAFEGDNLMHLMSSRNLIQKTLFTPVDTGTGKFLLINYYLKIRDDENKEKNSVVFTNATEPYSRQRDSIVMRISAELSKALDIDRIDKKSDIISVKIKNKDEFFAKTFVEALVNTVIQYYTDYKVKKIRQNVAILQHQTDSIRNLINGNIVDIAVSTDLNVNPTREIARTGIQRKQVDAQVNGAMYTELVKNLELSKLTLRKETPLIQIIDTPMFPLEKHKMGTMKAAVIFGFIGFILTLAFLMLRKIFSSTASDYSL